MYKYCYKIKNRATNVYIPPLTKVNLKFHFINSYKLEFLNNVQMRLIEYEITKKFNVSSISIFKAANI